MDDQTLDKQYAELRQRVGYDETTGAARRFWEQLETENLPQRQPLLLTLTQELLNRHATITDLFLAYVYANSRHSILLLTYIDDHQARSGRLFRSGDICRCAGVFVLAAADDLDRTAGVLPSEDIPSVEQREIELDLANRFPTYRGRACAWRFRERSKGAS